uniref:Phosphotransferase n=1 Tax=Phenylobacterium glaciei TaxID=2803784 RepID=A0A974P2H9_9CAUL|nr:phosphotransferase [Phenylobacterium glaciei]
MVFGGKNNTTFHLGDEMSVRLPSARHYVAQVEKEQAWLPRLAPQLPLPIPEPVGLGAPGEGYPWPWSVYRWIEGETAALERIADLSQFARDLAAFLTALQAIDVTDGPVAGQHNFFRGGALSTYDAQTRQAIIDLGRPSTAPRRSRSGSRPWRPSAPTRLSGCTAMWRRATCW